MSHNNEDQMNIKKLKKLLTKFKVGLTVVSLLFLICLYFLIRLPVMTGIKEQCQFFSCAVISGLVVSLINILVFYYLIYQVGVLSKKNLLVSSIKEELKEFNKTIVCNLKSIIEDKSNGKREILDGIKNLYTFHGLKEETRRDVIFQNFEIDRKGKNKNPIYYLWADTYKKNRINAEINEDSGPYLSIYFESNSDSFGCDIAIRPQEDKALNNVHNDCEINGVQN